MPKNLRSGISKYAFLADFLSNYVYNFHIYCGRNLEQQVKACGAMGESTIAHRVVTQLCSGLEYLEQCITMDNYFSSIPLFVELASKGIYATSTIVLEFLPI